MNLRPRKIVFVSLLLLFLGIEFAVRLYEREARPPLLTKWPILALYPNIKHPEEIFNSLPKESIEWAPYQLWAIRPNLESRFFHINALGFRGPEIIRNKPAGRTRIVVLGGSSAWGFGCTSDDRTVPGRLQSILHEQLPGQDIEVINAGQIGYDSTQELIYFHRSIRALNPDLVLLFDGYNDVLADFINPVSGWPLHADLLKSRFEDAFHPRSVRNDLVAFIRQSKLVDLVLRRISEKSKPKGPIQPSISPSTTAEMYLSSVLSLIQLAAPVPVWVALQPVPVTILKPLAPEEVTIVAEKERSIQNYNDRVRKTYHLIREGLRGQKIATIDLDASLGTEPVLMFADECHFGDVAADRIATSIAREWILRSAFSNSTRKEPRE
ncbi:MAG: SGNH/GDSL hydrolase family protein [Terriglobia bacterium]